jgi:hypothetical protein
MFKNLQQEAKAEQAESAAHENDIDVDVAPVPIDELLNQGVFISLYGETSTLKSSMLASLPDMSKKRVEEWRKMAPDAARMVDSGFFPDLYQPGSIGVMDLDKKWGAYLGKGDWPKRGFKQFALDGVFKIFQIKTPEVDAIYKDGKMDLEQVKIDLDLAKKRFMNVLKQLCNDKQVKAIIIDPISKFLDMCTRKFFAVMNKVMPDLTKSVVDPSDGLRQSQFGIRNQWFHDVLEILRGSGKWIFLTFNMNRVPPQYQKAPAKDDQFNTSTFKVSWTGKTPESTDQITFCYRIPNVMDSAKDEYHFQFKKGPWRPVVTDLIMPNTPHMAPVYFNTIAKSLMGE